MSKLNLQEVDQEQALNLSKFFISSGQNVLFLGRKGTGKTQIALQAIKESGYKVNYINLSVLERSDLSGFPDINSSSDIINYKSPYYLPPLQNSKPDQVILFDELDKASPEIMAPLLEILQFKTINGKPINVASCILTGNLMNEGAYSNMISTAILDRMAKYVLQFNLDKWLDWGRLNNVYELILGFIQSNQDFACGAIDDVSYASPSPRGWTLASDALKLAKKSKISDIQTISDIVSGFVGNEAGLRFKLWYEHYRKFEPHAMSLINNGLLALDFNNLMLTEKFVFVISACYFAKQKIIEIGKGKKYPHLNNLCKFFDDYKIDQEMQIIGLYNSFDFEFITKYQLYKSNMFFEHFQKLNKSISIKR